MDQRDGSLLTKIQAPQSNLTAEPEETWRDKGMTRSTRGSSRIIIIIENDLFLFLAEKLSQLL